MMPVKKDASGRRYVQAEVEVPGTPEEVWQAIATGPGISSWFVPTTVEGRVGGAATSNFGPGMESVATITSWDPPHRFAAESRDATGPNDPTVATEWIVEARSGGTCIVRVVHSWFAESDVWDNQFEGHEHGWQAFFRILRLYLTYFRGEPGAAFQVMGIAQEPVSRAWDALIAKLGIAGAAEGQHVTSAGEAPRVGGWVERTGSPEHPELLVRLDTPAPGVLHLFAMPMGGRVYLPVRVYLYGDDAAAVVARDEPMWTAWMNEQFPADRGTPVGGHTVGNNQAQGVEHSAPATGAALLLVDVQNDFCPGGALAVPGGDQVIPVLNRIVERFTSQGRPVYASRDWHPPDTTHFRAFGGPWPPHCVAESRGAAFHPDLRLPPDAIVISKGQDRNDDGYSAFEATTGEGRRLLEDLRARGITELYVGGLATDYCVRATVLDARRAGFPVTVLTDGIAGIGREDANRALDEMRDAGASLISGDDWTRAIVPS